MAQESLQAAERLLSGHALLGRAARVYLVGGRCGMLMSWPIVEVCLWCESSP